MPKKVCFKRPSDILQELLLKVSTSHLNKKPSKRTMRHLREVAAEDGGISYQEKALLSALAEYNSVNKSILEGLQEPGGLNQTFCLSLKKKPSRVAAAL